MYAWSYEVLPDHQAAFVAAYGPDGAWTRLFRLADGYLDTRLYRDHRAPDRFVTIDRWSSADAFDVFRKAHAAEFEALDRECARWTRSETELGRFAELT